MTEQEPQDITRREIWNVVRQLIIMGVVVVTLILVVLAFASCQGPTPVLFD